MIFFSRRVRNSWPIVEPLICGVRINAIVTNDISALNGNTVRANGIIGFSSAEIYSNRKHNWLHYALCISELFSL